MTLKIRMSLRRFWMFFQLDLEFYISKNMHFFECIKKKLQNFKKYKIPKIRTILREVSKVLTHKKLLKKCNEKNRANLLNFFGFEHTYFFRQSSTLENLKYRRSARLPTLSRISRWLNINIRLLAVKLKSPT